VLDARSDLLQRRGAEVVVADIFDPGQLLDAMRGVQRAYYCPPDHPFVIQSASAFVAAARETGLEQIVGLSQWLALDDADLRASHGLRGLSGGARSVKGSTWVIAQEIVGKVLAGSNVPAAKQTSFPKKV
jgi:uncharacterized protein YbjT (DUF2867 family)